LAAANNFWPSSYSPKTKLLYIPSDSGCNELKIDRLSNPAGVWRGGAVRATDKVEGDLVAFDPLTGEVKK
jgi:alcohol dehydrogenase (cytochrome c)